MNVLSMYSPGVPHYAQIRSDPPPRPLARPHPSGSPSPGHHPAPACWTARGPRDFPPASLTSSCSSPIKKILRLPRTEDKKCCPPASLDENSLGEYLVKLTSLPNFWRTGLNA